ncbi:HTH myb-type domain-containing protein [Caerostris darwini]|uniref:HTH myb-type domain-containing protein n=1 Tax=Caerostris darwini TaxID=1538125 RepID=A0AAV4PQC6_9ARAC|nr:HTH myb-type domain-containing protein [Caerostris darwini]
MTSFMAILSFRPNANLVNCSREAPVCYNTIPQINSFPLVQIKVEPPSMDEESTSLPMVDYANVTLNLQDQRGIDISSLKLNELAFPDVEFIPGLDVGLIGYSFDRSIYEALKQEDQNDGLIPIPSVMTKLTSPKSMGTMSRKRTFLNSPVVKSSTSSVTSPKHSVRTPPFEVSHDSSSVLQTPKMSGFTSKVRMPTPIKPVLQDIYVNSMNKKQNFYPPKRSRKALHKEWMIESGIVFDSGSDATHLETPIKSLLGDSSVTFSPPSIVKDTIMETKTAEVELHKNFRAPLRNKLRKRKRKEELTLRRFDFTLSYVEWRHVTFGRTTHQEELTY